MKESRILRQQRGTQAEARTNCTGEGGSMAALARTTARKLTRAPLVLPPQAAKRQHLPILPMGVIWRPRRPLKPIIFAGLSRSNFKPDDKFIFGLNDPSVVCFSLSGTILIIILITHASRSWPQIFFGFFHYFCSFRCSFIQFLNSQYFFIVSFNIIALFKLSLFCRKRYFWYLPCHQSAACASVCVCGL